MENAGVRNAHTVFSVPFRAKARGLLSGEELLSLSPRRMVKPSDNSPSSNRHSMFTSSV